MVRPLFIGKDTGMIPPSGRKKLLKEATVTRGAYGRLELGRRSSILLLATRWPAYSWKEDGRISIPRHTCFRSS